MRSAERALVAGLPTSSDVMIGGISANVVDGLGKTISITDLSGYKQIQVDINWEEVGQIGKNFNVSLITLKMP